MAIPARVLRLPIVAPTSPLPWEGPDSRAPLGLMARQTPLSEAAVLAAQLVDAVRPNSLRAYDQIAMDTSDLARQALLVGPSFPDLEVVFVGDHDGMSLMFGLLGMKGLVPLPARMILFDFDKRLLEAYSAFANQHGFGQILSVVPYNVLDPLPKEHTGRYDAFYTNPPYGSRNEGESPRLFLTRCLELVRPEEGPFGYAILPFDLERPWTRRAMQRTQAFMTEQGWCVGEAGRGMHRYLLDDDPDLRSASMLFEAVSFDLERLNDASHRGRRVSSEEIPHFYGANVPPPYPRYIGLDGSPEGWDDSPSASDPLLPQHTSDGD